MTDYAALVARLRHLAEIAEGAHADPFNSAADAIEALQAENNELRQRDVAALMDKWVAIYGPMPWSKAVNITAIVTGLDDAERERLLALDDAAARAALVGRELAAARVKPIMKEPRK